MKLSDGEWKIVQLLWKKSPQSILQLTKDLEEETGWTKHTVISYLKRMEEKGAVQSEQGQPLESEVSQKEGGGPEHRGR